MNIIRCGIDTTVDFRPDSRRRPFIFVDRRALDPIARSRDHRLRACATVSYQILHLLSNLEDRTRVSRRLSMTRISRAPSCPITPDLIYGGLRPAHSVGNSATWHAHSPYFDVVIQTGRQGDYLTPL